MSSSVPGSAGLPLVGDKSYDFYKDPIKFQHKHMDHTKSRVFLSRFLNKPTIFIGSNNVLREVLTDHSDKMEFGYKQFMGEIYGENILFTDGDFAHGLRGTLRDLFTPDSIQNYKGIVERIVKKSMNELDTGQPVCAYMFFKKLAVEVCLGLFLGLDFSQSESDIICELTTTHWHGIISVPVAIKIPKMSASTYSKALDAKHKLLEVIRKRREEKCHQFPRKVESLPDIPDVLVNNHLLLFTSALVPKALSSILTSFVVEMGQEDKKSTQDLLLEDSALLEAVLLETLRMHPPFLGGRRVITKEFSAGGYRMPAGQAILYMTYLAHRDPEAFQEPDTFNPQRWINTASEEREKLFSFGCGPRNCLGQSLVWTIIHAVLHELLTRFKFSLVPGQDLTYKWLPVSRPKGNVFITCSPRS